MGFQKISMQTKALSANFREKLGKGPSRRLRTAGQIPAVVYGKKMEAASLVVNEKAVDSILKTKLGANTLIDLNVDNKKHFQVLIKDYQGDILTRKLKHVDFFVVDENQEVFVEIPIHFTGKAVGLTRGGILEVKIHELQVYAQVGKIPEEILVDITELNVGDNIHLKDITLPQGLRTREGYNPTIVIMTTITEEEIAAATAPAAAPAATVVEGASEATEGAAQATASTPAAAEAKDKKAK